MNITFRAFQIFIGLMLSLIVESSSAVNNEPAANSRYVIHGDTVYDKKTDLTWQRCSIGQQWSEGSGCTGIVKTFTFNEAQQQGVEKWRMPTKDELATLIDNKQVDHHQKPTIDEVAFPDMDKGKLDYWTGSLDVSKSWHVSFDDGSIGNYYDDLPVGTALAVRLVRSGQ